MLMGDMVNPGASPLPMSGTVCGLPTASSLTLSVANRVPPADGVNVILMVQLEPAGSPPLVIGHVVPLVMTNSLAFAPVIEILAMLNKSLPVLFRVISCAAPTPTC